MLFVSATKGIETTTLARMSEVVRSDVPFPARIATLSGPTFAREIAKGEPAAVVIASPDDELASSDPVGLFRTELCGCTRTPTRRASSWAARSRISSRSAPEFVRALVGEQYDRGADHAGTGGDHTAGGGGGR